MRTRERGGRGTGDGAAMAWRFIFTFTFVTGVSAGGCSDQGGGGTTDAAADVPSSPGDGSILDLMPHEHVAEHGYDDDAGRPGTLGASLSGPDRQWTWVTFVGSHCRDGSPAGIGFNPSSASKNLLLFLDQ